MERKEGRKEGPRPPRRYGEVRGRRRMSVLAELRARRIIAWRLIGCDLAWSTLQSCSEISQSPIMKRADASHKRGLHDVGRRARFRHKASS